MALNGNEVLWVVPVAANGALAATQQQTTTAAIAQLAALDTNTITETSITTVGNGTLTAGALVGGQIARTGPVANYTDTTATAAQIVAALPSFQVNQTFVVRIKNATLYTQTLAAGTGITLPPTVIIPPFSVGYYFVTVTSATAATFTHMFTTAIANSITATATASTALNTVGAGTITAAGIVGGITTRGGSQAGAAFTDTTDTAANIIAAQPGLVNKIGTSFEYLYENNTNAVATITGGTGVTVSQITTVPAGMSALFLVTYTAAATITMVGLGLDNNLSNTYAFAGATSGQTLLKSTDTAGSGAGNTLTLPTVTGTIASTTGSNLYINDLKRSSATVTSNSTTLANVTGLSFTVVPGTYKFKFVLQGVADATGGIKYAMNYTTTVLSALQATAVGTTAAAAATQSTTSTSSQALLFDQAAAVLQVVVEGTMVVTTGGTIDVQAAQHAANASSTTVIGSSAEFIRIA